MKTLAETLKGQFVIVNLGAAGDTDCSIPRRLRRSLTLIEVDATNRSYTGQDYFRRVPIQNVVAGARGVRQFRVNKNPVTSSLLEPREDRIKEYGREAEYEIDRLESVECITLYDVLCKESLSKVDFIKVDLEGLDYEVIRSVDALLDNVIAIQCELRFQPFYHGEPCFHEVVSYLDARGFEVIGLEPEYWKPVTAHRRQHIDGRITFCDVTLFKKPDFMQGIPACQRPLFFAKQIILACMLGKKSYAEYVLESHLSEFSEDWLRELRALTTPRMGTFVKRSLMSLARYGLRFTVRRYTHKHIVKGCRDEFYVGGPNR
jgi:FkbM family methyltransferase